MGVVSVDLAYKDYRNIGIAVLKDARDGISCEFVQLSIGGEPVPGELARALVNLCEKYDSNLLLLDGPQGWRADKGSHPHSRDCERKLNTPAKTGMPSIVKPVNYAPFAVFSIAVFDALGGQGWQRLSDDPSRIDLSQKWAIESFPRAAWLALGSPALRAKRKTGEQDIKDGVEIITKKFEVHMTRFPNHDELQALVAGLAGVWLARRDFGMIEAVGLPPRLENGTWREGFILNPRNRAIQPR